MAILQWFGVTEAFTQFKKLFVVTTGLLLNLNTTLSSSLPSGAIDTLAFSFHITSRQQIVLPVAVFLLGYFFGPIVFGPVSESYGRRICFIVSFAVYTLFTLACALAPNWPALLLFRFFVGVGASAPQTVTGGMYAEIYPDLIQRGRVVMILGLTSNVGPLIGPVIAGYSSRSNWRWMFWIALIMTAINWPLLLMLPGSFAQRSFWTLMANRQDAETFPPIIVRRLGKKQTPLENTDIPKSNLKTRSHNMKKLVDEVLTRPIKMFSEPLILFTDLFLLYQYSIFYLNFESYTIIFGGTFTQRTFPPSDGRLILLDRYLWSEFGANGSSASTQ